MVVRIKFAKYSVVKFIGHLDVMRYFQKANRRAKLDVAYSAGFNPHQIMSFAAPLGVGLTSDAEYVDIELNSITSKEEAMAALNEHMNEGFYINGLEILKEREENVKKETAMSQMAAADYMVSLKDGYELVDMETFKKKFMEFYEQEKIVVLKKTKKSEREMDIKKFIYDVWFEERGYGVEHADTYESGIKVYMQLATGSVINIKPDLVMEAFCKFLGKEYQEFAFQYHRMECYGNIADNKMSQEEMIAAVERGEDIKRELVPLLKMGIQG